MIVTLRETGRKPPFFFIHGNIGIMPLGSALQNNTDHDQPLYAVHYNGLDGNLDRHAKETQALNISELALTYVDEILDITNDQPVRLGGMCVGAMIALEAAREIQKRGIETGSIVMIDPPPIPKISGTAPVRPSIKDPNSLSGIYKRVHEQMQLYSKIISYHDIPFDKDNLEHYENAVFTGVECLIATSRHNQEIYHGPVQAIVSHERVVQFFNPDMYWKNLLPSLKETIVLPYSHRNLFMIGRDDLGAAVNTLILSGK